jgi:hypothetical protein
MAAADTRLGTRLGKYRLVHRVGEGGTGVVYAAEDPVLTRRVAIKILSGDATQEPGAAQRFIREARAAARLNHPNVVTVYDMGRQDDITYIVMELVDGASAQAALAERGTLPWPQATRISADVCRGLAAAHGAGLIHRDIKPSNILLGGDGSVKLSDFGLAKAPQLDTTHATQPGTILGTPHYMSPEQCAGEHIDARADLYALGGAYYALLTGRPPYSGSDGVKVMYAHCTAPIPDPRNVVPSVPEACTAVVAKAMAKKRADRFRSAQEMLAALTAILETPPMALIPTAVAACAPGEARQPPRAHLIWTGAAVASLAIASSFVAIAFSFLRPSEAAQQQPAMGQSANITAVPRADAPRVTLRPRPLLGKHLGEARGLAFGGRYFSSVGADKIARVLDLGRPQAAPKSFEHPHVLHCVALSPDGKWLATGNRDQAFVSLWDVETGKELGNLRNIGGPWSLAFHPSAKRLAVGSGGQLLLIDLDDDAREVKRQRLPGSQYVIAAVAFTPDGRRLGAASFEPGGYLLDGTSLTQIDFVARREHNFVGLAFSADGKRVAFGTSHELWLWETSTTGSPTLVTTEPGNAVINAVAFAPGDRQIVHGGTFGGPVKLHDLATGRSTTFPTNAMGNVTGLAFSPDGRLLAATCTDGSVLAWDVIPEK